MCAHAPFPFPPPRAKDGAHFTLFRRPEESKGRALIKKRMGSSSGGPYVRNMMKEQEEVGTFSLSLHLSSTHHLISGALRRRAEEEDDEEEESDAGRQRKGKRPAPPPDA